MHRVHLLIAQGQIEHCAATIDVVTQQVGKAFGVGRAPRPAQQGNLLCNLQMLTVAVACLREHPRQSGNAPGVTERLPHAEVTDLGDGCQCAVQ